VLAVLDGMPRPISELPAWSTCSRFELAQRKTTFDPLHPEAKTSDVSVRHVVADQGLWLGWQLTWSAAHVVKQAYGAMLPAARGPVTTTKARFLDSTVVHDIGKPGHLIPRQYSAGIEMYNTIKPARMTLELQPGFFDGYLHSGGRGMWVSNNDAYNKVYPTRIFEPTPVSAGESWTLEARYSFAWPVP